MPSPVARMVVKNMGAFLRELSEIDAKRIKAGQDAAKIEGYRLHKVLVKGIRAGAPGGQAYDPLTAIARRYAGKFKTRKPFTGLLTTAMAGATRGTLPVRYKATVLQGAGLAVSVGFTSGLSNSWRRIGRRQQEGFSRAISKKQRRWLARIGGTISKFSKLRKFFFLKKSTRQFRNPRRPIIDPFWRAERARTERNLVSNFEKKMSGERI